jgi:metallo-beta-lactamase family protein
MTRTRHTPYKAQLAEHLAGTPTEPFSARSLADEVFDNGTRDRTAALRGIQEALREAYADGRLVQFHDADGKPLCDGTANGGSSTKHTGLYASAGVAAPDGATAVMYADTINRNGSTSGAAGSKAVDATQESPDTQEAERGDAPTAPAPMTAQEARRRRDAFVREPAPSWLDDRVLRIWVSFPESIAFFRKGLDRAQGPDKLALIRAGITRKPRGGVNRDSPTATNLAELLRHNDMFWSGTAAAAFKHYADSGDAIDDDELPALAADPLEFYDSTEHAPDVVVLNGLAVGADRAALEVIAGECPAADPQADKPARSEAENRRIGELESQLAEMRREFKGAEKELRAAREREESLHEELAALRAAHAQGRDEAQAARAELESRQRERADKAQGEMEAAVGKAEELEEQIRALEDRQETLEEQAAAAQDERRLREQAEQDVTRLAARVRELTGQLDAVRDHRNLPVEDAVSLVSALARPIGQAARHAAERLAGQRARDHDHLLLELASTFSAISRRMTAAVVEDDETPDTPTVAPETVAQAEVVSEAAEAASASQPAEPVEDVDATAPAASPSAPATAESAQAEPGAAARRRRRSRLRVRPLGGAGEVGGSAILVTNQSGHNVLLDCGQRVRGEYGLDTEPPFHHGIGVEGQLHAILISHAHIDHVGSLPVLHRLVTEAQNDPVPVYMTAPTRELTRIMLDDSAKIQQSREAAAKDVVGYLDYAPGTLPAEYGTAQVSAVMHDDVIIEVPPARAIPVEGTSFVARFLPVSHVLGSCAVHLTDTDTDETLLYTGDLGPITDPQITLPQYSLNEMLAADIIIMESTYGRPQPHETEGKRRRGLTGRERALKLLYQAVAHAHEHDGAVLLPAFSLGRTQELLKVIGQGRADGELPSGGEICVAGMGERIVQVYSKYTKEREGGWARAEDIPRFEELGALVRSGMRFGEAVGHVLDEGFSYIIASPAMLTSGWSRAFLREMIAEPRHSVIMSGYMPRHSGGIPHLHRLGQHDKMQIDDEVLPINALWEKDCRLSAHAPSGDLRQFARHMARQRDHVSFGLVHGDPAAQDALRDDIADLPNAEAESLSNGQVWRGSRPA